MCVALVLSIAGACAGCASSGDDRGTAYGDLGPLTNTEPTPGVLSREPWTFGSAEGEVIRTAHYRLFTTESDAAMRARMPTFLEYALSAYRTGGDSGVTLPPPPQKLDTYLMDNRPQWDQLTARLMGVEGKSIANIQRGGFASRGIGVYYDLGQYDTLAIAGHEGWHQYTQRTFKDVLPPCLEEGMATQFEGYGWTGGKPVFRSWSNLERFDRLRALVAAGRLKPLQDLIASQPKDFLDKPGEGLLDFYAQAWALIHFLREGNNGAYRQPLAQLLNDAVAGDVRAHLAEFLGPGGLKAQGQTSYGTVVFRAYFDPDLAGANRAYKAFVEAIVQTGGRERVTAGKSPVGSE